MPAALYADLASFKTFVRIPEADETDDAELLLALGAASRSIDHHCDRTFGPAGDDAAVWYGDLSCWNSPYRNAFLVRVPDLMDTDDLAVDLDLDDSGTWATPVIGAVPGPVNAPYEGKPWQYLTLPAGTSYTATPGAVRVTAKFGWTAVPDDVREACLLQAHRLFRRRDAAFGIAGSPDMGNELRLLTKLDPDVAVLLRNVKRYWGAR